LISNKVFAKTSSDNGSSDNENNKELKYNNKIFNPDILSCKENENKISIVSELRIKENNETTSTYPNTNSIVKKKHNPMTVQDIQDILMNDNNSSYHKELLLKQK